MCTSSITLGRHVLWQLVCWGLFVPLICEYSEGLHLSHSVSSMRGKETLRSLGSNFRKVVGLAGDS